MADVIAHNPQKILLAEDEEFLSRSLEAKLIKEGFGVTVVTDGAQVLDVLAKEQFDIVLLDLIMPKMNGFDVLARLHADHSDVPVIVISNLGQDNDIKQVTDLGAKKYFVKSNTPLSDVVEGVKEVLDLEG